MIFKIKDTVQIGGHTFDVVHSPYYLDGLSCKGESEYRQRHTIRLLKDRPATQKFQTFIHEGLHQIDHVFGNGEMSEELIQLLAGGLCQMLLSMGLEPDFSDLPTEEVNINAGK